SQTKLDKLDKLLKHTSTSAQDAALFSEMLSLPNDGRYPAVELTPQQRRQRTLEALALQMEALARSCPVMMVFEDAHWSDPTSLELLGRAVDRIRTLSVLLAVALVPSPALAVPAALHASLMARLDRLGPGKELAQIGAAIGREFSHPLLAAVVRKPEAELQTALDRLIGAGLLLGQGGEPYATYSFKHALVRDAAYSTLLREPR